MLNLNDDEWNKLFDAVDLTVSKAMDDLPQGVKLRAVEIGCIVDKYHQMEKYKHWKVLGCYMKWTNGPVVIYVGQIFEDNNQDIDATMQSVRQVYYHELAHAVGNLEEYEVEERGL